MNDDVADDSRITPAEVLKLLALGLLYLVQGLPYGYLVHVLPITLREEGVSLTMIALAQMLALPWMLKVFIAPWVDANGNHPFGRRKSLILPLQLALAATMALAMALPVAESMPALCGVLLLMNVFAATMDVPVDGLAVDTLRPRTVGFGNAVQVSGFRIGMIIAGGSLMQYLDVGLGTFFGLLAGGVLLVHFITWFFPERRSQPNAAREPLDVSGAIAATKRTLFAKDGRALVVFILLYKAGEAMADSVFRPMLVDAGLTQADISLYVNTYGSATALMGPVMAGFLVQRFGVERSLVFLISLRVVPIAGELCVVLGMHSPTFVIGVTLFEHLVGSAITTLAFALMMSVVDPRVGATQFTALATLENVGKGTLGFLAGPIGDGLGLVFTYVLALVLTFAFAFYAPSLIRRSLALRTA